MISNQACAGFDYLLVQALKSSMVVSSGEACDVTVLVDPSEIGEKSIVVLTVSSYLFRLMVMIYFSPDNPTKAYFARKTNVEPSEMDEQLFHDAIAECGNICCGILNRELGGFFAHTGMSTPNIIDSRCAEYVQKLNCGHIQHFNVDLEHAPRFHVTLCVSDYADIDFSVEVDQQSADTGELELF